MPKQRVLCVMGTRPEAIKMAPVIRELQKQPDRFETRIMVTAQHRHMLDQVLQVFRIQPDVDLNLMTEGQTLNQIAGKVLHAAETHFRNLAPDVVLAQGDTTTVMATAMACFHCRIPFGHVEAGLRTGDRYAPYPEEFNRRVAALVSEWHFAPTRRSAENLIREGAPPESVHVTGNTVIDALRQILAETRAPALPFEPGSPYILMTCHRREIFGAKIRQVFEAVRDFARQRPGWRIWYPVHPNPNVSGPARDILGGLPNVHLSAPLDYIAFVHAMAGAHLMLSDSGGVQEEAPSLGKPVVLLRETTERPEGVHAGSCVLAGADRDKILSTLSLLVDRPAAYEQMARARNPYGDGRAAERIVAVLAGAPRDPWEG